jgi:microcystin degradation protein MlrC
MGGKTDQLHGGQLVAQVKVIDVYSGKSEEQLARHGGFTHFDQGLSTLVRSDDGLNIAGHQQASGFLLEQLQSCGLKPIAFNGLVAKGVSSPIAAYKEIGSRFIQMDTPGVTPSNLNHFSHQYQRNPLFSIEQEFEGSFLSNTGPQVSSAQKLIESLQPIFLKLESDFI